MIMDGLGIQLQIQRFGGLMECNDFIPQSAIKQVVIAEGERSKNFCLGWGLPTSYFDGTLIQRISQISSFLLLGYFNQLERSAHRRRISHLLSTAPRPGKDLHENSKEQHVSCSWLITHWTLIWSTIWRELVRLSWDSWELVACSIL